MAEHIEIREALNLLDVHNDEHWTKKGLADLNVVRDLAADPNLTREDVDAAAPGFTRTGTAPEPQMTAPVASTGSKIRPDSSLDNSAPATWDICKVPDFAAETMTQAELEEVMRNLGALRASCITKIQELARVYQHRFPGDPDKDAAERERENLMHARAAREQVRAARAAQQAELTAAGLTTAQVKQFLVKSRMDTELTNRKRQFRQTATAPPT